MPEAFWQIIIVVLAAGVAVHTIILLGVMRQLGGILLQMTPARPGEVEEGPEKGTIVSLPGAAAETETVVVFVSPTCTVCKPLLPAFAAISRHYPNLQLIAVITGGDDRQREELAIRVGHVARPDLHRLYEAWDIPGTPFAVAIDSQRRVRLSGVVNNLDQLEALAESLVDIAPFSADSVDPPHDESPRSSNLDESGEQRLVREEVVDGVHKA